MPGVGATLFAPNQTPFAAGPSEPPAPVETTPPPSAAFFSSLGVSATAGPSTTAPGTDEPAAPAQTVQAPNASTFPAAPSKPFNPFERIQALAKAAENTTVPAADPGLKKADVDTASLFGGSPLPPALAAEPAPPAQAPLVLPSAPASLGEKEVKLNLAASLKNCAPHDLGTNPENIPSWVQFTLSYDILADQLSSGRVVVPLDAVVAGLDTPIRSLFTQARSGVQVELPSNAVFQAVSELSPAAVPPTMPPPVTAAATPPATLLDPFSPLEESSWEDKDDGFLAPQPPSWSNTASMPAIPAASDSPQAPETKPCFTAPVAEQHPAPLPATAPVKAAPVIIPANPLTGAPEFVSPAPVPPPQGSFVAAATPRSDNGTRRLLLTALLGSPDATDPATIVKLTGQLPGVAAVLCVKDHRPIAEVGDDSPESQRFLRDAPSKITGLTALASLTGIEDAETLHIQSGQVEATFCLQGTITFAVLHDPRRREPALKEKITLLGREIAAILGESPAS